MSTLPATASEVAAATAEEEAEATDSPAATGVAAGVATALTSEEMDVAAGATVSESTEATGVATATTGELELEATTGAIDVAAEGLRTVAKVEIEDTAAATVAIDKPAASPGAVAMVKVP